MQNLIYVKYILKENMVRVSFYEKGKIQSTNIVKYWR